jgi:hypothetical protein
MSAVPVIAAEPTAAAAGALTGAEIHSLLELSVAQLEGAVKEADGRVDRLAHSLVELRQGLDEITQLLAQHASPTVLAARIEAMNDHVNAAAVAIQFYDKLTQRLAHVREGLQLPRAHIDATEAPHSVHWADLCAAIRARYSMVEERVVFDFLLRGTGPEQMLQALTDLRGATNPGELELF